MVFPTFLAGPFVLQHFQSVGRRRLSFAAPFPEPALRDPFLAFVLGRRFLSDNFIAAEDGSCDRPPPR